VAILGGMRFVVAMLCGCVLFARMTGEAGTLAQFRTPLGDIEVELFDSDKPVTVQNFIRYVQGGLYQDNIIHRWVPEFVIQGGGYYVTNRMTTNAAFAALIPFDPIINEYQVGRTFSNTYGTIAMARASGQTNSATSQWFFNLADNPGLDTVDGGFTVFGKVVRGTNVLNRFNLTSTNNGIYKAILTSPLDALPVLATVAGFKDLVYVDVSLLHVQLNQSPNGERLISWQSVSNTVNHVEVTAQFPPSWQELFSTNGTGQAMQFRVTPPAPDTPRFYRVRVDY
jgi:cyclophilin family peptidyl-prolyl cis-trans isomerase